MYGALHEVEPSKCLNEWMKVTQLSHQLVYEKGEKDIKRKEIKGGEYRDHRSSLEQFSLPQKRKTRRKATKGRS